MTLETTSPSPPVAEAVPVEAALPRVRLLNLEGKQVVLIDASNLVPATAKQVFVDARPVVATHAPKTALTLTDVTGMVFDDPLVAVIRETISVDAPYVKAGAVVGVTGLKKIVLNTLNLVTSRNIRAFGTREQALAWLVQQG